MALSDDAEELSGYLADVNWIDGRALDAAHFGEYDADSPNIWIPKKYNVSNFCTHIIFQRKKIFCKNLN